MTGRNRRHCVPTSALRDILRREFPPYEWRDGQLVGNTTAEIAREVGCDERAIRVVMNPGGSQSTEWTDFDKADRILTRLGLVHEWHTNPALIEVGEYLDSLASKDEVRRERQARVRAEKKADLHRRLVDLRRMHGVGQA